MRNSFSISDVSTMLIARLLRLLFADEVVATTDDGNYADRMAEQLAGAASPPQLRPQSPRAAIGSPLQPSDCAAAGGAGEAEGSCAVA